MYDPIYITPAELEIEPLPAWSRDPIDPIEIDWYERVTNALIPFNVINGFPYNPMGQTGKIGRNLPKWGENQAADPIVKASGKVLLIKRDDCGEWAIPGGMVDPGELAKKALVRELKEETQVDLETIEPKILAVTYVDDPRNSDNAWIVSTVALFEIEQELDAIGSDDALEARWFDFSSMEVLESDISKYGKLYEAHRPILMLAL